MIYIAIRNYTCTSRIFYINHNIIKKNNTGSIRVVHPGFTRLNESHTTSQPRGCSPKKHYMIGSTHNKHTKTRRGWCSITYASVRARGCGIERSLLRPTYTAHEVPPNTFPFVDKLPSYIVTFISSIPNFGVDGNCGYRSVSWWFMRMRNDG